MSVHEHEPVISRLSDVLGYLKGKSYSSSSHSRKGGGKGKKQENGSKVRGDGGEAGGPSVRPSIKTVAAAAAAAAEKEEEEEEDIFQDAGTDFNNDDDNDLEGITPHTPHPTSVFSFFFFCRLLRDYRSINDLPSIALLLFSF